MDIIINILKIKSGINESVQNEIIHIKNSTGTKLLSVQTEILQTSRWTTYGCPNINIS
jgi:deoxyribose-phosphate aldolase